MESERAPSLLYSFPSHALYLLDTLPTHCPPTGRFRACIDSTLHSTAEGHIFTLSHARLLIRLVDTDGNQKLDKVEFRYLWKHISAWSNFFLSRAHVDPAHGPIWPLTAFSAYLRLQLQAFRMPGDGTDAQLRDKIDNVVDLVCESLSSSHGYLIISDFYSVQASLALVGKFSGSLGAVPTLLDMLRFSYYVRG